VGSVLAATVFPADLHRFFGVKAELEQLLGLSVDLATRIPDLAQIVAFRNQLIHGYARVNAATVWNISQQALPPLLDAVQGLLDELG